MCGQAGVICGQQRAQQCSFWLCAAEQHGDAAWNVVVGLCLAAAAGHATPGSPGKTVLAGRADLPLCRSKSFEFGMYRRRG